MTIELHVSEDADAVAAEAADWLVRCLEEATSDPLGVALAGGSTPQPLHRRLATPELARRVPWRRTHWFLGDERLVPEDHPASNFRAAREALFEHVAAPADHLHPVATAQSADEAARRYAGVLDDFARRRSDGMLLDVVFLGLGDDGHTASLFPGDPALEARGRVAAVVGARPEDRVTLTYQALAECRNVAFLVTGAAKGERLAQLLAGDTSIPAARVRAPRVLCFADRAAATS